jgi:hypothetical protein
MLSRYLFQPASAAYQHPFQKLDLDQMCHANSAGHFRDENGKLVYQGSTDGNTVVFSSYFGSKNDTHIKSQKRYQNKKFFNSMLMQSVQKLGDVRAVVFEDQCRDDATSLTDDHCSTSKEGSQLSHQYVDIAKFDMAPADVRFQLVLKYITERPDIQCVFIADNRDVSVLRNPGALCSMHPTTLFVAADMVNRDWSTGWFKKNLVDVLKPASGRMLARTISKFLEDRIVLNSGVVGGSREVMLQFLTEITAMIDKFGCSTCRPTDMSMVNYIAYSQFSGRIVTGFPYGYVNPLFHWNKEQKMCQTTEEIPHQCYFFAHKCDMSKVKLSR